MSVKEFGNGVMNLVAASPVAYTAVGMWGGAATGYMAGKIVSMITYEITEETKYSGTIKAVATFWGICFGALLGFTNGVVKR
jgi:hypothetical protein